MQIKVINHINDTGKCTSLDNDSLNMWNYYIKNGKYQGYNIGLSVMNIIEDVKKTGFNDGEM